MDSLLSEGGNKENGIYVSSGKTKLSPINTLDWKLDVSTRLHSLHKNSSKMPPRKPTRLQGQLKLAGWKNIATNDNNIQLNIEKFSMERIGNPRSHNLD